MDFLDQLTLYRRCLCLRAAILEAEFQGEQFRRSAKTSGLGRFRVVHRLYHKFPHSNHMGMCFSPRVLFGAVLMFLREEYPMRGTHGGPLCRSLSASSV